MRYEKINILNGDVGTLNSCMLELEQQNHFIIDGLNSLSSDSPNVTVEMENFLKTFPSGPYFHSEARTMREFYPHEITGNDSCSNLIRNVYTELDSVASTLTSHMIHELELQGHSCLTQIKGQLYPSIMPAFYYPTVMDTTVLEEHVDYSFLTFIVGFDSNGLEVFTDKWVPISLKKNQILVITGSLLADLTRGKFTPTRHKVMSYVEPVRLTFPFFILPRLDFGIRMSPESTNTITYRKYCMKKQLI